MLPSHTGSSAVRGWADPGTLSLMLRGSKLVPAGMMELPSGSMTGRGCYKTGCCPAQRALARGLVKGHMGDTGTTMPPAPSLAARPPQAGARGIDRVHRPGSIGHWIN